jgi:Txe/YoeB family toxin of Txe-Axe toxin-antitoxin module
MSIECGEIKDAKKIEKMKTYTTGQLLYLLREIERTPYKYSETIIKECYSLLYDKNITCI